MDNLFVMDPHEIEYAYRHATNKRQQISILADLNGCSNQKIIDFLKERGIEVEKRPYTKKPAPAPFTLAEAVPAPAAESQRDEPLPLGTPMPRKEKPQPERLPVNEEAPTDETSPAKEAPATPLRTLDITPDEGGLIADVLKHTLARCSQEIFDLKRRAKELEEKLAEQEQIEKTLSALIDKFEVLIDVC